MKNIQRIFTSLLGITTCALLICGQAYGGVSAGAKHDLQEYFSKAPWIGLIADEIIYGPLTLSHMHIHDGDKLAIVSPGETLCGTLRYRIKAEDLHSLHRYHLVVGIKDEGAQDCVTHSMGVWDSKGKGRFKLKAPDKPGIYQVRFLFVEGTTCSSARDIWNSGEKTPHSNATIGVIIVE